MLAAPTPATRCRPGGTRRVADGPDGQRETPGLFCRRPKELATRAQPMAPRGSRAQAGIRDGGFLWRKGSSSWVSRSQLSGVAVKSGSRLAWQRKYFPVDRWWDVRPLGRRTAHPRRGADQFAE